MHAQRIFRSRVVRVVPGAGRKLHHAGTQLIAEHRAGEAGAAIVEQTHDVAVAMPRAAASRGWMRDRLAPANLRGLAGRAEIELAVQPRRRLVGDKLQREARRGWRSGAFNAAAARRDGRGNRHSRNRRSLPTQSRSCRSASAAAPPSGRARNARTMPPSQGRIGRISSPSSQNASKSGASMPRASQRAPGRLVEVAQPLARRAALGERLRKAQPLGQPGKNGVIVARLAIRRRPPGASPPAADRPPEPPISSRSSVIVAGKHDVGVARRRGPGRFMHDHRVRPGKRPAQPVEILVVVERIAAGPIDQPDVGIGQAPAVVVERLARMQQHVGDARHRDEIGDAVAALAAASAAAPPAAACRYCESSPAHRRSRRPAGRSAPASRPARRPSTPAARHARRAASDCEQVISVRRPTAAPSQIDDRLRRQAADRGAPRPRPSAGRRCGRADSPRTAPSRRSSGRERPRSCSPSATSVCASPSISATSVPGLIGCQVGLDLARQIVAQRADQMECCAARVRAARSVPRAMCWLVPPPPTSLFFSAMPPNASTSVGFRDQFGPADVVPADRRLGADDVRQDHRRRAGAVAVDRADIAAEQGSGTGAPGSAHGGSARRWPNHRSRRRSRRGPCVGVDPAQLAGSEVERFGPGHRHEFVASPPPIRARTIFQPAAPNHRLGDPRPVPNRGRDIAEQSRGVAVARMRNDFDAAVPRPDGESTPVRTVRHSPAAGRWIGCHVIHRQTCPIAISLAR